MFNYFLSTDIVIEFKPTKLIEEKIVWELF